jgi:hypothetical protein
MSSKGIGGHTTPNHGATDSWITPKFIIDALGPFDLDPCQCDSQPWPCATMGYHEHGLEQPWFGRVWLNPPYSSAAKWLEKLADHGCGTALIFARTETEMFQEFVWNRATGILFLWGRLFFHYQDGKRAKGNSGAPSVLIAYGKDDAEKLKTCGLPGAYCTWMCLPNP